jgi:hypothetical protein
MAHDIDPRDNYCNDCQSFGCSERRLSDEVRAMQTATHGHTIAAVLTDTPHTREDTTVKTLAGMYRGGYGDVYRVTPYGEPGDDYWTLENVAHPAPVVKSGDAIREQIADGWLTPVNAAVPSEIVAPVDGNTCTLPEPESFPDYAPCSACDGTGTGSDIEYPYGCECCSRHVICAECGGDGTVQGQRERGYADHFHVNLFVNGCLNDASSGPYDDWQSAYDTLLGDVADSDMAEREEVSSLRLDWTHITLWEETEPGRFQRGRYIWKVEPCREEECYLSDYGY